MWPAPAWLVLSQVFSGGFVAGNPPSDVDLYLVPCDHTDKSQLWFEPA